MNCEDVCLLCVLYIVSQIKYWKYEMSMLCIFHMVSKYEWHCITNNSSSNIPTFVSLRPTWYVVIPLVHFDVAEGK